MTNDALCELLIAEPEQGLTALIREYGGYVHTIVRNKIGDTGTTEDIEETVSDVFVMLWQWIKAHPDTKPNLRAMLAVMAKRHAINRFRALTRHSVCISIDEVFPLPQETAANDESIILIETIRSLGEPDSEVILRRYYFGQSSREIGAALGLNPNTVDKKISRGIKKLHTIWKED